jgi:hypothetical protein
MSTNLNNTLRKLHAFNFILLAFCITHIPNLDANDISVEEFFL